MAKIYYARDGYGDDKEDRGREVDFAATASLLTKYRVRPLGPTRTINGDRKADWTTDYKYVVFSVEVGETTSRFPTACQHLIEAHARTGPSGSKDADNEAPLQPRR